VANTDGRAAGTLYAFDSPPPSNPAELRFVPYFAWANREPGEMLVWLRDE
jgi:DUF1680 family protein